MIDIDSVKKIYFIGIGGIAMSAAAGIAKSLGFEVSGSESKELYDPAKAVLDEEDISYYVGYEAENVKNSSADIFVISAGESLENPEVRYVYENSLEHISFSQLLYELNKDVLRVVVTGTHGKSTTAAMLGFLLMNLDRSSFLVGAVLQNLNRNFYRGSGHYFVFEGDEYKAEFDDPTPKFHYYKPDILVLTNLEYDHPDLFPSLEALEQEFAHLISNLPEDGLIIYNADDSRISRLAHESNLSSASFGVDNEADYKVTDINYDSDFTTFEVFNKFSANISSRLLGQTEQYKIQLP